MQDMPHSTSSLRLGIRSVPYILALVPFLYLIYMVWKCYVDMPFFDEWTLVLAVDKSYQGTLTVSDLFRQHMEHRPLFPTLILLPVIRATGWNISYEIALSIALALGMCIALVRQAKYTLNSVGECHVGWLIPIISVIVFSLKQQENWLWGWQVAMFLNLLAAVVGIMLLCKPAFRWVNFAGAMLLGAVASYSFASGLNYWHTGLILLLLMPGRSGKERMRHVVMWCAVAAVTVAVYFHGFDINAPAPAKSFVFSHPFAFLDYVFSYLGNPVSTRYATPAGVIGVVLLGSMIYVLRRMNLVELRELLPYIGLGVYCVSSAVMTGIGRASIGQWQALSPRYITMANLLWISNVTLLLLIIQIRLARTRGEVRERQGGRAVSLAAFLILGGIVCLAAIASIGGVADMYRHRDLMAAARAEILAVKDDEPLRHLAPFQRGKDIMPTIEILKRYHLSVFRETAR